MEPELDHPILQKAFEYEVTGFNYQFKQDDICGAFIELSLRKNGKVVVLKFDEPSDIWIERGFPVCTHGLCILDISSRQMEDQNIEVTDFEATQGQIHFYAKSVEIIGVEC